MKNWKTQDLITAEDWNRIRRGLYDVGVGGAFPELLETVTAQSVPTQQEVDSVRRAFSYAVILKDAAAGWPDDNTLLCEIEDLENFPVNETYPNLTRFFDFVGNPYANHFPAAAELNLYESILNYGKNRFGSPLAVFGGGITVGGGPFG